MAREHTPKRESVTFIGSLGLLLLCMMYLAAGSFNPFIYLSLIHISPLLTIQVLGLIYKKKQNSEDASDVSAEDEDSIIVLEGAEHECCLLYTSRCV